MSTSRTTSREDSFTLDAGFNFERSYSEDNILIDFEREASTPSERLLDTSDVDVSVGGDTNTEIETVCTPSDGKMVDDDPFQMQSKPLNIVLSEATGEDTFKKAWEDAGPAPETLDRTPCSNRNEKRAKSFEHIKQLISRIMANRKTQRETRNVRRCSRTKTAPSKVLTLMPQPKQSNRARHASEPMCNPPEPATQSWPIIFFDWDDTLFPTWYVINIIKATRNSAGKYTELSRDSPHYPLLRDYAELVRELLVVASGVAEVRIITLSKKPWVTDSSDCFLPGLDLPELLSDLNITVHYAKEYVKDRVARAACDAEGVNVFQVAKTNAMEKCFTELGRKRSWETANVISVGDSTVEREACRDLMWYFGVNGNLCKTVKLIDDPSLDMLTMEVRILISLLPRLIKYDDDDADISFDENSSMHAFMNDLT